MTPVQHAWESFSNTMRAYGEVRARFDELLLIDREEAINNGDRAFEAKLEKFHTLYDVTDSLPGFDYFGHGDTSLLIVLRNAIHHRDHSLFKSWNSHLGLNDGLSRLAGAAFLLGSTTSSDDVLTSRYYLPLHDFYARLSHPKIKKPQALKTMWDTELLFANIAARGASEGYPAKQVYVDVMPAFMSAVRRVSQWLAATGFQPMGEDGEVFFDHFRHLHLEEDLAFMERRIPLWLWKGPSKGASSS